MGSIEYDSQHLSRAMYQELFEAIQEEMHLQTQTRAENKGKEYVFVSQDPATLTFDIDVIANAVALKWAGSNRYPFEARDGLNYASVHTLEVEKKKEFSECIRTTIFNEVHNQLSKRMKQTFGPGHTALRPYAQSLLTPIETFARNKEEGLHYYNLAQTQTLEKRNLHASEQKGTGELWLKGHKFTLSVSNIESLTPQIVQSICTIIEQHTGCDEDDLEDVRESLTNAVADPKSNLNQLKNIVIKESVARIYREARVAYLEYIRNSMRVGVLTAPLNSKKKELTTSVDLLSILVDRLHLLDAYIRADDKAYDDYDVFIAGESYNLRDIGSRADAFNPLPIMGEIDGFLGETTDVQRQSKTFTSGSKIKLNGPVNNHGGEKKSVFEFNSVLLDPCSPHCLTRARATKTQAAFHEKILRVALLYCFVFVEMDNPHFQPGAYFEQHVLPALKSNDDTILNSALQQLQLVVTQPSVTRYLDLLRTSITFFLQNTSVEPSQPSYSGALTLDKSILTKAVNEILQGNFFRDVFDSRNGRNALKYIAVTSGAPSTNTLGKLSLTMTFAPIYYAPTDKEPEIFAMSQLSKKIKVLPTFLCPVDLNAPSRYGKEYEKVKRVALYYRHHAADGKSARAFVYRFTYTLLAYTVIKLLAESLPQEQRSFLFTPIICIHAHKEQEPDEKSEKYDDETFMHSLSKQLAHMLGEDYISGSQGFSLDTVQRKNYNLNNALYSLYSSLPHFFQQEPLPSQPPVYHLPKLAIIAVTSRKCDENKKHPDAYLANLIGKVIGIERTPEGGIIVRTLNTFSANQHSKGLYSEPTAIIEQVKKYHKQGYNHFLYVARAPYSSTLNISDGQDLYFMNKDVIQAMRSVDNTIKVYPAFCDKYFVIDHRKAGKTPKELLHADSLYIDDIGELTKVSNDPSRRSQIFFNLFNGITVNPNAVYTGVMSYSTLINVYTNDPTYDQYIWNDLLNMSVPNSMKAEILDLITLLHFSRFEKTSGKDLPIGFKLDPYTDIIGDDGVGAQSIFPHMDGKTRFNALAFLTAVRAVMHAKKSEETK